jgi:hypothetical protein
MQLALAVLVHTRTVGLCIKALCFGRTAPVADIPILLCLSILKDEKWFLNILQMTNWCHSPKWHLLAIRAHNTALINIEC